MENTIEAKKEFLVKELEPKGYTLDEFFVYLRLLKEDGDDLNKSSIDELTTAINDFYKSKQVPNDNIKEVEEDKDKAVSPPPEIADPQIVQEEENFHIDGFQDININGNQVLEEEINDNLSSQRFDYRLKTQFGDMTETYSCIKPDLTEISDSKNLIITLSYPEKKIVKKLSVSFLVESQPFNYKVRRTIKEILWLREILKAFFPGVFIPPLSKDSILESTSIEKIEKKMLHYQRFLNLIAQDDLLRTCKIFFDFLTTPDEKEYMLKIQAYEKIKIPTTITQIQSITGSLNFEPEILDNDKHTMKTNENIQKNITLLTKLNKSFKCLMTELKQVNNRIYELSDICKELTENAKEYQEDDPLIGKYEGMKSLFAEMYYSNQEQWLVYEMDLKQHFKFVLKEFVSLKDLRDKFIMSKNNYMKTKGKLLKKKEDLFKKKDYKNWDLKAEDASIDKNDKKLSFEKMLPDETKNLHENKQFCCYLGCSFENEFLRIRNQIEEHTKLILQNITKKSHDILNQNISIWSNFSQVLVK